jgi:hypothetical protein
MGNMQNMEPNILGNGHKNILNGIMGSNVFLHENAKEDGFPLNL